LKSAKTPEECETHYFSVLMQQTEKINYQTALIQRADPAATDSDREKGTGHKLDK